MVRTKSARRLDRILDASCETFLELGYRRARVDEVAARADVSVGSLYQYAAGKEALFALTLRRALGDAPPDPADLPFRADGAGRSLVDWVWTRFQEISPLSDLEAVLDGPVMGDPLDQFEAVVRRMWDWMATYWPAIELIERCARDWPELHMLYFKQFRRAAFGRLQAYLVREMDAGALRPYPDPATALRVIVENLAFFAMHRHVRPDSADLDEETSRETVVQLLRVGFTPEREMNP